MTGQNWETIAIESLRDAAGAPRLAPGEVHIWRASQIVEPATLSRLHALLDPDEKARAERFVFQRDRDRFIVARGVLRELLAAYIGCASSQVAFDYGPQGKPSLHTSDLPSRSDRAEKTLRAGGSTSRSSRAEASRPAGAESSQFDRAEESRSDHAHEKSFDRAQVTSRIRFNASHSHGLAAFAFALDRELGIDVELIRADFGGEEIAQRFFSPDEVAELLSLPPETRAEAFFLCWTRKEAYIKARSQGLQIPLASFSVSLTPGRPEQLRAADTSRWHLRSFQPIEDYAGALVAEAAPSPAAQGAFSLRFFDWRV
jgi:4'-phosphopantetheinyl transferase